MYVRLIVFITNNNNNNNNLTQAQNGFREGQSTETSNHKFP
jgi:hypothetical protein